MGIGRKGIPPPGVAHDVAFGVLYVSIPGVKYDNCSARDVKRLMKEIDDVRKSVVEQ
jgi:hypothetical protein